jgi:Rad52/22 family double-strand break repair protein
MRDRESMGLEETAVPAGVEAVMEALAAPFEDNEVKFRPGVVAGARALALPYVDARVIMDRLDEVLGGANWQDEYECLPEGSVVCRLRLRLGEEWITKMDVGGQSEQPDEGDRRKAAFSDALKRAAVKFGVGRYLYRLAQLWVDWDVQKKKFARDPRLPVPAHTTRSARPSASKTKPMPAAAPENSGPAPAPVKEAPVSKGKGKGKAVTAALPANGEELRGRLYAYDARLAGQGLCNAGDLVKHVVAAGQKAGHDGDLGTWSGPAIVLAVEETKTFEAVCRERQPAKREVA